MMKLRFTAAAAALALASTASAQDTTTVIQPVAAPAAAPIAAPATTNAVLRAGTPITLRILQEVTTKEKAARVGQRIKMEVASDVVVNGVTVIPSGSLAEGEVTSVRNKGMWGKSGRLEARALYARVNGRQIRLTGTFDDKGVTGTGAVVGAALLLPVAGFFMTGTSAVLPAGGEVPAFIDEDVQLAMVETAPAPMQVQAAPAAMTVPFEATVQAVAETTLATNPPSGLADAVDNTGE